MTCTSVSGSSSSRNKSAPGRRRSSLMLRVAAAAALRGAVAAEAGSCPRDGWAVCGVLGTFRAMAAWPVREGPLGELLLQVADEVEAMEVLGRGRGLVARVDIPAGTLLLHERTVSSVPAEAAPKDGESPDKFAARQSARQAAALVADAGLEMCQAIIDAFCPGSLDHPIFTKREALLDAGVRAVMAAIAAKPPAEATPDEALVRRLLAAIQLNSFHLTVPKEEVWYCVAFHAAILNHSCQPNATHFADPDTEGGIKIAVRSVSNIKAGEEICIAYTELLEPTVTRKEYLDDTYFFDCTCPRCSVTDNLDAFVSPEAAEDSAAISQLVTRNERAAGFAAAGRAERAVDEYARFLELSRNVLDPHHHWVYNAHLKRAQLLTQLLRPVASLEDWRAALAVAEEHYPMHWPTLASLRAALAKALASAGGAESAVAPVVSKASEVNYLICRGRKCDGCNARFVKEKRCSRCLQAVFCSSACFKRAWKKHKPTCKPVQKE
eukprot:m.105083 g.105083  ORF g.105083 m.105083 type:complete len:495 (-) comp9130_c0_seq2:159-1643(-)